MKQTVYFDDFASAFNRIRPDNFSRAGLRALFEYLENWENDTGEELDLDVISICCDFSEETIGRIIDGYSIDMDGVDDDDKEQVVADFLMNEGSYVAHVDGGFIYRNF